MPSPDKALHSLKFLGYYRFTGYCLPFQDNAKGDHAFVDGTSFDDVLELYAFDKALRTHILGALEGIEVAFRATVSNTMSLAYGPHWYLQNLPVIKPCTPVHAVPLSIDTREPNGNSSRIYESGLVT